MGSFADKCFACLGYGSIPTELAGLNPLESDFCRAIAETMYPEVGSDWPSYREAELLAELAHYLRAVVPRKRRMIRLLFTFAELAGILRPPFRRFSRLTPEARSRMLERWDDSRFAFLNLCSTSLRTLVNLAYLSHPKAMARTGQTPRRECEEPVQPRRLRRSEAGTYEGIHEFGELEGRTVREEVDFVVVGTGPGGAVVARELAEAGRSVIAIERGVFHRPEEHPPSAIRTMRDLFAEQGLRHTQGNTPVRTMQAHALGGTSVVNSAICWRAPDHVFDGWRDRYGVDGLSRQTLDPHYDKAEREAAVAPTPENAWGRKGLLFRAGCDAMGVESAPMNRAVRDCAGCSECFHGCRINAKQSMDRCYIPSAIEHGARFFTSCRAEELIYESGRVAGVRACVLDPNTGARSGQVEVRAKAVVLSAGVMASPLLLMKNRLPGLSSFVGHNLCFHNGISVTGVFDEEVNPWIGGTQDWQTKAYLQDGLHMEVVWVPSALMMARARGYGAALHNALAELKNAAFWCIAIRSSSRGRLTPGPRGDWEPRLRYSLNDADVALLKRGMDLLVDHHFAAGAVSVRPGLAGFDSEIRTPAQVDALKLLRPRANQFIVAGNHVYGTCAMGADPARSVVDSTCAVHGVPDLYVCDTSVFPAQTAVNPQLTLMAIAGRLAGILNERY